MYTLIHYPSHRASTERWQQFLEEMLAMSQDDRGVRAAVQAARDELDVRAGRKTLAEISARRHAENMASMKIIREGRERRAKEEKK
jgi:hypothetical protein